jgi:L-threonylcarbamoyladenylate synthase
MNNFNILEIKNFFEQNKILILPTDTVFGLFCSAYSALAVKNLFELKKRDRQKSFSIFCSKAKIHEFAHVEYDWQQKIIDQFFPGPITLILKLKNQKLIDSGVSKNGKIGIRIPSGDFWEDILGILNFPLVATSVNFSGKKPACFFEEIHEQILLNQNIISKNYFPNWIKKEKKASSIFDLTLSNLPESILIVREGEISKQEIFEKLK